MVYVILYIIVAVLMFVLLSILWDVPEDRDTEYKVAVLPAALFWPVVLPLLIIMVVCISGGRLSHKIYDAFHKGENK